MAGETEAKKGASKGIGKGSAAKQRTRASSKKAFAANVSGQPRTFAPDKAGSVLRKWYRLETGGKSPATEALSGELRLARQVDSGFPTKAVDEVIDSGLVEPRVMYEIVIPRRTLADRKQKDKPLSAEQSDRLARMLRVYARAEEAIGDALRAHRWLHKDNRALGGKRPIDLLASDAGTRAVEKVLGRIEHGIVS